MENKIKEILQKAKKIELQLKCCTEKYCEVYLEVVMNSEIDFVFPADNDIKKSFKIGEDVVVKITTKEAVYVFKEKCVYITEGKFISVGVKFPTNINKEQKREFVRTAMERNIIILIVDKNEKRDIDSLVKNFSVDLHEVKTVDISGGGLAFYSDIFMPEELQIMIDMEFISPKLQHYRQKAEVIRCKEVNEQSGKYIIAVAFIELSFAVQEEIKYFVFAQMRENCRQRKKCDNI